MMFNLGFPNQNNNLSQIKLKPGEMLFVLGANGAGKSSLMQLFTTQNYGQYRKISAHRQTWMSSDTIDMTPSSKRQTEQSIPHRCIKTMPQRENFTPQRPGYLKVRYKPTLLNEFQIAPAVGSGNTTPTGV